MRRVSFSSSSTIPPSPSRSLPRSTAHDPLFPTSTIPSTPTLIPFLDISSPATSVLPPTPPTSLVTPLPPPGLMLLTPAPSAIPFPITISSPLPSFPLSSPPFYATPHQLCANLASSPFIGILPGASSEILLAPQPLCALYLPATPSPSIFTSVVLPPLDQADLVTPLSTLPPLLIPRPSPSNLPHPRALSFTLSQISSSPSSTAPTFSTFPPTTPSPSDPAL